MPGPTTVLDSTLCATDWVAVTPDVELSPMPRSLFIGTGGDVALVSRRGNTVVHKNVASGTVLSCRPKMVAASGTNATNIVAWY